MQSILYAIDQIAQFAAMVFNNDLVRLVVSFIFVFGILYLAFCLPTGNEDKSENDGT